MLAQYVKPLISSAQNVFKTMLRTDITFGDPSLCLNVDNDRDVSGIIGLTGDVIGSVIVSFPKDTAIACVEAFTGVHVESEDDAFSDAIGELANMIAGSAKSQMDGLDISISCPSVVVGPGHSIARPSGSQSLRIPVIAPFGEFDIYLCISQTQSEAA